MAAKANKYLCLHKPHLRLQAEAVPAAGRSCPHVTSGASEPLSCVGLPSKASLLAPMLLPLLRTVLLTLLVSVLLPLLATVLLALAGTSKALPLSTHALALTPEALCLLALAPKAMLLLCLPPKALWLLLSLPPEAVGLGCREALLRRLPPNALCLLALTPEALGLLLGG